ncbi:winged helix-turn-helix domain-containing protein [Halosegnis marinus]|uniref:Helix-turn-helix domain-containing protein n=1 Tax=Halosegnis marinus TaxID=3034023 RepID=A0ABD5ZSP7_9EURY|nr:winged helix-turn-helix domain-containing protein [Halosegnis sp. DT85]
MSSDDSPSGDDVRERIEQEAEELDQRLVDLLAWVLDTETRARIYIELRQHPGRTSEEIAEGTGLYPSTVREALAALHDDGTVTREKRKAAGAGNNPYEYEAIAPADLVGEVVEEVQEELNTVFNLDAVLGDDEDDTDTGPVTVSVTEEDDA